MARLSALDLEAIRKAVERAEGQTAGEIVPVVVRRSAGHEAVSWRGAAAGAALGAAADWVLQSVGGEWAASPVDSIMAGPALVLAGAAVGLLLVRTVPVVFRMLAGGGYLDRVAHARALQAFVDEEVFDTRDRTGIVLLVSQLERRIVVLGDAGINAHVQKEQWAEVVDIVRSGLRSGDAASAIVQAIERCGALLRDAGVSRREDDQNELPDDPRVDPDTRFRE